MTRRLLYDGPHLQVVARPGHGGLVLATFNDRVFRANGSRFWGDALADRLDLAAVGFVTKRANWFPVEDFARALDAAQGFVAPFAERIGYGYSQGGYAAIRASQPLELTATVALSPQFSIDPEAIVDRRYNRLFDPALNTGMTITADDAPSRLLLLSDHAHRIDRRHRDAILAACGSVTLVNVPFSDHRTVEALKGTETFQRLLAAVRAGEPLGPVVARARRASPVRQAVIVERAVKKRRLALAEAVLRASRLGAEDRAEAIRLFLRAGAVGPALRLAEDLAAAHPDDPFVGMVLAEALAASGRCGEALAAVDRALSSGRKPKIERMAERVRGLCAEISTLS